MYSLKLLSIVFFTSILACSSTTGIDEFGELRNADDSSLSQAQKTILHENAVQLAYQEQIKTDPTFINISEDLISFYYDVLVTVSTSEIGMEYEVTSELKIFNSVNLFSLIALPNADAPFLEAWKDSTEKTGIESIDNILSKKGFVISDILFTESDIEDTYVFENNVPTNTLQITKLLEKTGYFVYAEVNGYAGDGGTILVSKEQVTPRAKVLKITYTVGYGDCPSGCIYNDRYIFHVYPDGQVEFIEKIINGPQP